MMNAMLISSGMPESMWGEAILSACYVLNRVPHKKLEKTPFELWKGYSPNLKVLKVWGCLAKVGLPEFKRTSVGPKTFDCVFIGYAQNSAAYRFMSLSDNSICEVRDAEFFELIFPLKKNDMNKVIDPHITSVPSTIRCTYPGRNEYENEPRRSKRQRVETSYGSDFITSLLAEYSDKLNDDLVSIFLVGEDPKSYEEAMTSIDASFCKDVVKSELDSIMQNHTWDLVDLPRGSKPIKCKWIFRRKLRHDGTIEKFKARLVVVGYTQKKGIDFFDTY